jgi:hypothetical protein
LIWALICRRLHQRPQEDMPHPRDRQVAVSEGEILSALWLKLKIQFLYYPAMGALVF